MKIANNLKGLLVKRATANPQIMYSPELGGFHTPGQYPQSMVPEAYQQVQARNMLNPYRGDEAQYFSGPQEYAMALNTGVHPAVVNAANAGYPKQQPYPVGPQNMSNFMPRGSQFGTPFTRRRDWNLTPYNMPEMGNRNKTNPFSYPGSFIRAGHKSPIMGPRGARNEFDYRFQNAAYDVGPGNPLGRTAMNPRSAQQVVDLANQMYNAGMPRHGLP